MHLLSIQIGKPQPLRYRDQAVMSAINKTGVTGSVYLSEVNFDGDAQADLVNHGGQDKAVNAYCAEHYPYWAKRLQRDLVHGAFGENVTVSGMTEDIVCIGDTFRLGEAVVQISQPRQPCFKLGAKHNEPEMPVWVQETGYTGYYFRVLKPGNVTPGTPTELIERHPAGITVAFANRIKYFDKNDREALELLAGLPVLAEAWRSSFQARLNKII
ncbi:MOSC domain-containing protein [Paenibacillus chartarius]|uniref:MOSC domain-containing protein n=1 Tax=Paenibacillus chartarius TaxID=747481 RepID=A0ABV6DRB9_9BACL